MSAVKTERPNRTPPLPPPPLDRHRPRWIAGTFVFLGVGVAIWWGVASYLGMLDRISAFERFGLPSTQVSVTLEPVTNVLYVEAARRTPPPDVRFTVVDPSGRTVAVRDVRGRSSLRRPRRAGHASGVRWPPSRQDVEGVYSIDVIGPSTEGAIVAIGDDVAQPSALAILGALFLLSISAVGGAVLLGRRISTGGRDQP